MKILGLNSLLLTYDSTFIIECSCEYPVKESDFRIWFKTFKILVSGIYKIPVEYITYKFLNNTRLIVCAKVALSWEPLETVKIIDKQEGRWLPTTVTSFEGYITDSFNNISVEERIERENVFAHKYYWFNTFDFQT